MLTKLLSDRLGATAIEYSLIGALIAVIIVSAVTLIGTDISNTFNDVANTFTN